MEELYFVAGIGLVIQYLIAGRRHSRAGWVLPVVSLLTMTYLQLFVWLPESHGLEMPLMQRSFKFLVMNAYTLVLVMIFFARSRYDR